MIKIATKKDWIRFILNNHNIYNTKETLTSILKSTNVEPKELLLDLEPWFETNNWWDDEKFVQSMKEAGVKFPVEIRKLKI